MRKVRFVWLLGLMALVVGAWLVYSWWRRSRIETRPYVRQQAASDALSISLLSARIVETPTGKALAVRVRIRNGEEDVAALGFGSKLERLMVPWLHFETSGKTWRARLAASHAMIDPIGDLPFVGVPANGILETSLQIPLATLVFFTANGLETTGDGFLGVARQNAVLARLQGYVFILGSEKIRVIEFDDGDLIRGKATRRNAVQLMDQEVRFQSGECEVRFGSE